MKDAGSRYGTRYQINTKPPGGDLMRANQFRKGNVDFEIRLFQWLHPFWDH